MWLSKEPRYEKINRLLSLHGQTGTTNGIERAQNGKCSGRPKNIRRGFFLKNNPNFFLLKYIG